MPLLNGQASSASCWRISLTLVRIALLQMNAGIDPERNFDTIRQAAVAAKESGACMLFTPECRCSWIVIEAEQACVSCRWRRSVTFNS